MAWCLMKHCFAMQRSLHDCVALMLENDRVNDKHTHAWQAESSRVKRACKESGTHAHLITGCILQTQFGRLWYETRDMLILNMWYKATKPLHPTPRKVKTRKAPDIQQDDFVRQALCYSNCKMQLCEFPLE